MAVLVALLSAAYVAVRYKTSKDQREPPLKDGQSSEEVSLAYLAHQEATLGPEHPDVATSLDNLAILYHSEGKYALAEPMYQRALKIWEMTFGPNHPDVATSLNNLASLYEDQGLYVRAEPLYENALKSWETASGPNHPDVATALNNLALLYQVQGKYARAEPLYERALKIREEAFGSSHPDIATSLNNLASLYEDQGLYARAEPLYQRALRIREAVLGPSHPVVATALNNLACLYKSQGLYARAEPLYKRSLKIREEGLGQDHPDVATSLNNLASLYEDQGLYARAEPLYEHALAIWEAAFGQHHPDVATSLNNLALLNQVQGKYVQAEPLYKRALEIREEALGPNHLDVATSLNNLASLYEDQGLYARSELLYERALRIQEAGLGPNHPDVATSLNNLALLHQARGFYSRAEPLHRRALGIQEAALGESHPDLAASLNNLALLYQAQGLYSRAEPLHERALMIQESAFGKNHSDVATSLNNLAGLYQAQGFHARAEPLYERALAIWNPAFGPNHPAIASSLSNLALLYKSQGLYTRAEPLYARALEIRAAAFGRQHPDVAASLNSLAILYQAQGKYARAESLYEHALRIQEAVLGKSHPDVANTLNNFALLFKVQGLYARAEPLYKRALGIQETALGQSHPDVASLLNNLGTLRLAQQSLPEALPLFARAFTISEEHLRQEVFGFSEARLASVLHTLREDEEFLYTLVSAHPEDVRVRHLALSAALLRKGRSIEEISVTSRTTFRGLGQADREAFGHLRALRTQLATLSLAGPGLLSPTDYQQRLKELSVQGDALEADLARRSAPLRVLSALPPPEEVIARVAATLPGDGALVEFITYRDSPLVPTSGSSPSRSPGELRYLVLLLFADGSTHALDLGLAEPIDMASLRLHDALAKAKVSYQPAAQALYARTLHRFVPMLGKVRHLFLSPDGQLALVPFAALHDGSRFLVDRFDITYLTSGRDLLPRSESISPARSVVVLADPEFGIPIEVPSPGARTADSREERSASLERFFSTLRADLTDPPWPPLPGTRKEAEAIQRMLPHAQLLLGTRATKQALLELETPGILHIATHGFFREDASTRPTSRGVKHFGAVGDGGPVPRLADPLLRSGLVLAGARSPASQLGASRLEDSLITASELAGLDLWGTQLVVLSACDTGRGDIKLGQGVYGLRRALMVAGAETVVASLWKINDGTTSELMEAYYRDLLSGQGRTSALRRAMQELRHKQPHPHFWAPFIALGLDAPLRGLGSVSPPTASQSVEAAAP